MDEGTVLDIAAEAKQAVDSYISLGKFEIPSSMFPEAMPPRVVMAGQDILKTLLAGCQGLACFDNRCMNSVTLRNRVFNHKSEIAGASNAYDSALRFFSQHGILYKEDHYHHGYSWSINVNKDKGALTEIGCKFRAMLIAENHRRRGIFRPKLKAA